MNEPAVKRMARDDDSFSLAVTNRIVEFDRQARFVSRNMLRTGFLDFDSRTDGTMILSQTGVRSPSEAAIMELGKYVKQPEMTPIFRDIVTRRPAVIQAISDVVSRYEPGGIVTSLVIEAKEDDNEGPPISIVIDTSTEGEDYDHLQDEFWQWWLEHYQWASATVLVELW